MARPPRPAPHTPSPSGDGAGALRPHLERARLELRALFRALDELRLAQELPDDLALLFDLDADFAEALWALDQPPGNLNMALMVRDTQASLAALPEARADFLALFDGKRAARVAQHVARIQAQLRPADAYLQVPGRDPAVD
ncbi:MAG TPA: hypothetical protein VGQ83_28425 [Polyangia bacterium]|jgi:hypothetical protein